MLFTIVAYMFRSIRYGRNKKKKTTKTTTTKIDTNKVYKSKVGTYMCVHVPQSGQLVVTSLLGLWFLILVAEQRRVGQQRLGNRLLIKIAKKQTFKCLLGCCFKGGTHVILIYVYRSVYVCLCVFTRACRPNLTIASPVFGTACEVLFRCDIVAT